MQSINLTSDKYCSGNSSGGVDLGPNGVVDAIVSRALEEAGPHILRVEVGYAMADGSNKTLRKFYRFSVSEPLQIRELTVRAGDASCFVSIAVENISTPSLTGGLTISSVQFVTADGLEAERIGETTPLKPKEKKTAVELFDSCGRLESGESFRYLFLVKAATEDAKLRGIACGDELGKAVFTWRKAMGEAGRISSTAISCPEAEGLMKDGDSTDQILMGAGSRFVVHGSGLSVDVAASAASRAANRKGNTVERALDLATSYSGTNRSAVVYGTGKTTSSSVSCCQSFSPPYEPSTANEAELHEWRRSLWFELQELRGNSRIRR